MKFKNKKEFGSWGEEKAIEYLLEREYKILFHNYRNKLGEIDIIASKDRLLLFIEVKSRKNNSFGSPQTAVNYKKQVKIKKVAKYFIMENNYKNFQYRFDVVLVLYSQFNDLVNIKHLKNSF